MELCKHLVQLVTSADSSAVPSVIAATPADKLSDAVIELLGHASHDACNIIKSILGCLSDASQIENRVSVIRACVTALRSDVSDGARGRHLTGLMLTQLDVLPPHSVCRLMADFLAAIRTSSALHGLWMELFPKLLSTLSQYGQVEFEGRMVAGSDARGQVLQSLCRMEWTSVAAVRLIEVLRDQPLDPSELEQILKAVLQLFGKLQYAEVSPLVYQLLRLSPVHTAAPLLHTLLEYFEAEEQRVAAGSLDKQQERVLKQCQATVIFHVSQSPGVEDGIVREISRRVRRGSTRPELVLSPFPLSLVLALNPLETCWPALLESTAAAVRRSVRERQLRSQHAWLRGGGITDDRLDVEALLCQVAARCGAGWELVAEGLLQLCLSLLAAVSSLDGERLGRLGGRALVALVTRRPELVGPALTRLVAGLAAGEHTHMYADAFSRLITACSLSVAEQKPILSELLQHLGLLPLATARCVLASLLPVLKVSMSLKDSLVSVLRRLILSKRESWRQVAVCGFLLLLRHFRVAGSLPFSQASQNFSCAMSQVASMSLSQFPTSANEALCLQLLGLLRRCLSQQAAVRATLYSGLHEVLCRNPELSEYVIGMLLLQLKPLLGHSSATPLKVADCLRCSNNDDVTVLEPLPHLLVCLSACADRVLQVSNTEADMDDETPEVVMAREANETLDRLTRRMLESELEDFGVVKETELGGSSAEGGRIEKTLQLLRGVYKALLDHRCRRPFETTPTEIPVLQSIFKKYEESCEFGGKKTGKGKKAGSKSARPTRSDNAVGGQTETPPLSLRTTTRLVTCVVSADVTSSTVESEGGLVRLALSDCRRLCAQLLATGQCCSVEGANTRHVSQLCCRLAPSLVLLAQRDDDAELRLLSIESLADLTAAFQTHTPDALPELLEAVAERCGGSLLTACQGLVTAGVGSRPLAPLCQLLLTALTVAPADDATSEQLSVWSRQLLEQPPADDASVCRQLVELCVRVTDRVSTDTQLCRQLTASVLAQLGNVEDAGNGAQSAADASVSLTAVNEASAPACLQALCRHLTGWLDAVDWCLTAWRATAADDTLLSEKSAAVEAALCSRLSVIAAATGQLAQTAVPAGPAVEAVLRLLTRLYQSLTAVVRGYLARSKQTKLDRSMICHKFERLAQQCGSQLTPHAYAYISYTENGGSTAAGGRAGALRRGRLVPALICSVEQYETQLVQLIERAHLPLSVRPSTSRDFRINQAALGAALQQQQEDGSSGEDAPPSSSARGNGTQPPTKRARAH